MDNRYINIIKHHLLLDTSKTVNKELCSKYKFACRCLKISIQIWIWSKNIEVEALMFFRFVVNIGP